MTQPVHFEFHDDAAGRVCIAGSFNGWNPEANEMIRMGSGKWIKDLQLAAGAHEYRYVVDGHWRTDPACLRSTPNPFGETNSLLVVQDQKPVGGASALSVSTQGRRIRLPHTSDQTQLSERRFSKL